MKTSQPLAMQDRTVASPLDFSTYVQERSRHFAGRDWVFRAIQHWLEKPATNPRYFLLKGAPGSGKTSISAQLANYSAGLADPPQGAEALRPGFLSAIHFCRAAETLWCDPIAFAESIAAQLQQRHPEFTTALAQSFGPKITITGSARANTNVRGNVTGIVLTNSQLTADEAFGRFLRAPIEALTRLRPDFTATILIDAIDESRIYRGGGKGIAELIARLERLSPNIRFILTTREDIYIDSLYSSKHLDLSCVVHAAAYETDLRQFVDARLGSMSISRPPSLAGTLLTMSNFLLVKLSLEWIEKEGAAALEPGAVVQGFEELVAEWLGRLSDVHQKNWRTDYLPVLGALLVAKSDLSIAQLERITGQAESLLRSNLSDLGFLLQKSASGYSIYHQQINEFLHCEHIGEQERLRPNLFYIPAAEQHARIVRAYQQEATDWRVVDWPTIDDYGLRYVGEHLALLAAQVMDGRLIHDFICHELLMEKRRRFRSDASFVADVRLSIQAALAQLPPQYDQAIRGLLIVATLTSFAERIPNQALAALAWAGQPELALGWAGLRRDPMDFIHIAAALQGQPDREPALRLLARSQELASKDNDVDTLCKIVVLLHDNGDSEASSRTAIQVLDAARGSRMELTVFKIARACARTGEMKPVFAEVARQSNPGYRGLLLASVAEALRQEAKLEDAHAVIDRAIEAANQAPHDPLAWCNIALVMARLGREKEASAICRRLQDPDCTARVAAEIGPAAAAFARAAQNDDARLFGYALDSALRGGMLDRAIAEAKLRKPAAATWRAIGEAAAEGGHWREAVAAIEMIPDSMSRLAAWTPLAQALAVADGVSFSAGVTVLEEASRRSEWRSERETILGTLAHGFARHAQAERAIALASRCIDLSQIRVHRTQMLKTLGAIGGCFADHGQHEFAAEVADEMERMVNLDDGQRFTPVEVKLARSMTQDLRKKPARRRGRAKEIDATRAAEHYAASGAAVGLEDLGRLLADNDIVRLQAIGAAAAKTLGAKAVLEAISQISNEFARARTLEIIANDLSASGDGTEASQFSLARLQFEAETMGRHGVLQSLVKDISIYWSLDRGRTLKKVYHLIRELESWWD